MIIVNESDYNRKEYTEICLKYENQEWQCSRCLELNLNFNGTTEVKGWRDFRRRYTVNKDCWNCGYVRKNAAEGFLKPGMKAKPKPRKSTAKVCDSVSMRYISDKSDKFWAADLYKKKVVVNYGRYGHHGSTHTYDFDSESESKKFFQTKVAEKKKKGYK